MGPFVSVNPPLNHATHSVTRIHLPFPSFALSDRLSPGQITTIYYERVHSKLNGSLFLWCGRRLRRADDIRFIRQNRVYRECERTRQTRLELEELLHSSFSLNCLVSIFLLLLINRAHRCPRRCHGSLCQSREVILLCLCFSIFKKKRHSIFYIEDVRIALGYRLSTHRKKRVF